MMRRLRGTGQAAETPNSSGFLQKLGASWREAKSSCRASWPPVQRNDARLFPLSSIIPMTNFHDAEQNDGALDALSFRSPLPCGLRGPEWLW
jgi:hypothetical protein